LVESAHRREIFAYNGHHDVVAARPQQVQYMKQFATKILIAVFGLSLATAPLAASAAQWGVGVNVGGPGYNVHAGYGHPGWRRPAPRPYWGPHPYYGGPRPVAVGYSEGYYGWAPGGYYGYYHRGQWFSHRRWNGGVWLYF
jgi:hypothetical protein